jgi:PAS domain S-box-containing protein
MHHEIEFVRRAFDNGVDAVAVFDDDLCARYWSERMAELSGIPGPRTLGRRFDQILPAASGGPGEEALRAALMGESTVGSPPFFAAHDAAIAHGHDWLVQPLSRRGRFTGSALVARALATRGTLHAAMAETEQRFRAMANSSPVLLWMSERDGMCSFFNATWLEFSGRPMDEEIGVGWVEGVHPEDFERCLNTYMDAFGRREPFEMEYRLRRHDGAYRWILDRGTPRFTPAGEFVGFIGSCVDITDRREAEDRTRELADDLGRANRYLSHLLHATSHDLREPVRTVTSFADVLEQRLGDSLEGRNRLYMEKIREGGQRLRELVRALTDFVEQRDRPVPQDPIDVEAVVRSVLDDLALLVEEGNARIEIGPLPPAVGDRLGLRRVFQNLLENAIKFRRSDAVSIQIRGEELGDDVVFSVEDDGIGFAPESAEGIFEMFARLHPRDRFTGSGVGLALVRDVVDRHGGKVWATSTPGAGSRFSVSLPRRRPG